VKLGSGVHGGAAALPFARRRPFGLSTLAFLGPVASRAVLAGSLVAVAVFGVATGASSKGLLLVGALFGACFLGVAIVAPIIGLAAFFMLTFTNQLSGFGPVVSLAKGAGGVLAVAWIYRQFGSRNGVGISAFRWFVFPTAAFLIWAVASALWASDPHVAFSSALRIAQGPLLVVIIAGFVTSERDLRLILYTFIAGGTLSAVAGMAGVTHSDNPNVPASRLSSGIGDPNYLAAVLIPAIALAFFMTLNTRDRLERAALIGAASLCLIAVFLTESRGGIIALAVMIVGSIAYGGIARRHVITITCVVGAFATVYLALIAPPHSFGRITSFQSGGGGAGRTDLWTLAADAFEAHPIQGIGLGNFTVVEPSLAVIAPQNISRPDIVITQRQPVHNTYLHIAAELGIVGIGLLLVMLAAALQATRRGVQRLTALEEVPLQLIGRGLFVGSLGMLSAYVFVTAQYQKQLWLMLGVLFAFARVARVARRRSGDRDLALPTS
jgi:O-antigen ligase